MDMEGDRLSSLPDDIIHKILSYNDTKHAIKTSALSYRWRSTWKSVQHLSFSCEDYTSLGKFFDSVDHVLSHRDNKIEVSSVKLIICKNFSHVSFQKLMKYAFSHNVQEITITCLENFKVEFPLSLPSSQSLKHLTLIGAHSYVPVRITSTWEFPALTTLHLEHVMLYDDKSLQVSNRLLGFTISVLAPQLENLSLVLDYLFPLFLGGLPYLEKADICIGRAHNAHGIISMLQQLNGVKYLTLNVEILEVLSSSSVELIPKQPSPFANLRSLEIYPLYVDLNKKENVSSVVKKYLLDLSPNATFKMISREEIKAIKSAPVVMAELRVLLDQEKAKTKPKQVEIHPETEVKKKVTMTHMESCWNALIGQIQEDKAKTCLIMSKLQAIECMLTKVSASSTAKCTLEACFSGLFAEANTIMKAIVDRTKIQCHTSVSYLADYVDEYAKASHLSS